MISILLAAFQLVTELRSFADRSHGDLHSWRLLVMEAAASGDLDGIFEKYVHPTQRKADDYIKKG